MHQRHHARAMHTTEPIVVAIDRGVELIVAAQRDDLHDVTLPGRHIDVGRERGRGDEAGFAASASHRRLRSCHAEIAWRKKPFGQSFERGEFRLFGDADSSLALHVGVAANRTDMLRQAIP
jgi:hypothetical protein